MTATKRKSEVYGDCEIHPAYGIISVSRVSGGVRLFGSKLPQHHNFIRLTIYPGEMRRSFSEDSYGKATVMPIIEVDMSTMQWAQMLTSLNVGEGTPCTIYSHRGDYMPKMPDMDTVTEKGNRDFADNLRETMEDMQADINRAKAILAKDRLTKADRAILAACLENKANSFASSSAFYLERFQEEMDKAATEAKSEVEAFITGAMLRIGGEELAERAKEMFALREGKPEAIGLPPVNEDHQE